MSLLSSSSFLLELCRMLETRSLRWIVRSQISCLLGVASCGLRLISASPSNLAQMSLRRSSKRWSMRAVIFFSCSWYSTSVSLRKRAKQILAESCMACSVTVCRHVVISSITSRMSQEGRLSRRPFIDCRLLQRNPSRYNTWLTLSSNPTDSTDLLDYSIRQQLQQQYKDTASLYSLLYLQPHISLYCSFATEQYFQNYNVYRWYCICCDVTPKQLVYINQCILQQWVENNNNRMGCLCPQKNKKKIVVQGQTPDSTRAMNAKVNYIVKQQRKPLNECHVKVVKSRDDFSFLRTKQVVLNIKSPKQVNFAMTDVKNSIHSHQQLPSQMSGSKFKQNPSDSILTRLSKTLPKNYYQKTPTNAVINSKLTPNFLPLPLESAIIVRISLECKNCSSVCIIAFNTKHIYIQEEACPSCQEKQLWEIMHIQSNSYLIGDHVKIGNKINNNIKHIQVTETCQEIFFQVNRV